MARKTDNARTVAISTAPYDEDNPGPYVTFVFRYRDQGAFMPHVDVPRRIDHIKLYTTEMLKAMGIIDNGLKRPAEEHDEVIEINSDSEGEEVRVIPIPFNHRVPSPILCS